VCWKRCWKLRPRERGWGMTEEEGGEEKGEGQGMEGEGG